MIRSENEYQQAVQRLQAEAERLTQQQAKLEEMDLSAEEIKRAMDPMRSFHEQLAEEVASYERLKRGEFDEIRNLGGIGQLLIGSRIALNISQRDLAERLEVHESQVSRDERNEYHGITIERAARILEVMGVQIHATVELPKPTAA